MKRVTFVTTNPTIDIKNWSGTEYHISNSLEEYFDLDYIVDLKMNLFTRATLRKLLHRKTQYSLTRSPEVTKDYAKQILKRLDKSTDIVFCANSIPIAYLESKKSKVFYTDATFGQMVNYYGAATGLSARTIKEGNVLEKQALDSSSLIFYPSEWAANSAINDYGISPEKVKVIPFGANIKNDLSLNDIKDILNNRDAKKCKIIFIGVNWERKRGELVVETVKYLNEKMNLPTELHIVGPRELPIGNLPPYIINHGFIDKNNSDGIKKIERLISESHFLFVPSKQECYGVVFCEAMSYGVPCISSNTGGIPTIIKNNYNGYILDIDNSFMEYAQKIYDIYTNKILYKEMALNAFEDYKTRLNWNAAGKTMKRYLDML